jgi:Cdc6-like AAA superfamily ATPase
MLIKVKLPTNMIVVGATGSGKTQWIRDFLKHETAFSQPVDRILYCYNIWQKFYSTMEVEIPGIEFHEGIPWETVDTLSADKQTILVADDLMEELANDKRLTHMFTNWRHRGGDLEFNRHNPFKQPILRSK